MSLPRPICTRIPPDLELALETRFDDNGWSPSEGLRAVIAEWLAIERFPEIEFRDTAVGRRAAVRGGPEVWEIVAVAESAAASDGLTAAKSHFTWVPPVALEQAIAYAETQPNDIRRIIERNRRLAGGLDS